MWTPSYDIIVETLTGSEFEVTVNDRDTVGYLKSEIQKYEGIPVSQQHLLYNNKELSDAMEMKDIPLVKGSRVKLVLGMKGGPISSKRLFTISSDYDNWLDMSDVFTGDDLINLQSPGLKLLLYKDNKKNVHRLMKVRAEKAGDGMKGSLSRSVIGSGASGQSSGYHTSQKDREAAMTKQKMDQIKAKLSMKKKRLGTAQGVGTAAEDDENPAEGQQRHAELAEDRPSECGSTDTDGKKSRSQGQHRHKKRHHHQHFHHHHHHHQQHDTVIKEEKTPIGYRPGASSGTARGSGGAASLMANGGHNSSMVGAIGSMLPGTTAGAHRKLMPAVIDVGRQGQDPAGPPFSLGLVNVLQGSKATTGTSRATRRTPTLELEKRSQIREHLQRNRSFKTISAKNVDFTRDCSQVGGSGTYGHGRSAGLERSLSFHSNGILNRMSSETTLDGGYGGSSIRRCAAGQPRGTGIGQSRIGGSGGCTTTQSLHQLDEKVSSASLHDLIELLKYTHTKQRTISNDSLNKLVLNYSKKMYVPHLYHHTASPGAGVKKSLPDINPSLNNIDEYLPDYDIGMMQAAANGSEGGGGRGGGAIPKGVSTRNDEDERNCKIASAEIAFKNAAVAGTLGGTIDKTYRTLCKSISDDSSVYELPKLLVREDSPVESFLGSYMQLETVALRGDSPKNNFTSTSSLQDVGGGTMDEPSTATMSENLLELRPIPTKSSTSIVGEAKRASESLLQLAQIAAENVKSSSVTPPAAAASGISTAKMFGSNSSLTAGAASCGDVSSAAPGSSGVTTGSNWCPLWNHWQHHLQQQHPLQHGPFSSSLQQLSSHPRHHHSDLGINELELKFVHAESLDGAGDKVMGGDASRNVIKLPAIPNLEINTSWLSSWDALRFTREDEDADDEALDDEEVCGPEREVDDREEEDEEEDDEVQEDQDRVTSSSCSSIRRPHRATSTSTSFIHSHLSISSDEDDLLNESDELGSGGTGGGDGSAGPGGSCGAYKAGGNKSKSIDLYEFRKAFGSSPTLLNCFGGVGTSCTRLVPQLSRLETIPSQYRRGYTNLNDACLSSSTSELECVSNGAAKKKHHGGGGLLPPEDDRSGLSSTLSKYRKNGNIPYVRSNENLNRHKVSLCGATSSSSVGRSGERRRSGDNEALGGGDALYLRHRQQSASGAGAGIGGGTRHLPGIRDHLASIADSELSDSVGCGSSNNSRHNSTGSNLNEDEDITTSRCFTVGGDFECRFSRLSCCSSTPGGGSKSVSPGGGVNGHHHRQHGPGLPAVGSGGGLRAATSSSSVSGDRNHRMLFGDEGRSSMQRLNASDGTLGAGAPTTTPLRPTDYYFPSDESLFNMDSFFDDFVEIDTSDIFDSGAEFININAPAVGGCKGGSGNNVLLPDIHEQQQQHQKHRQLEQLQKSSQYLYFLSKEQEQQGQQELLLNTASPGVTGKPFSRLFDLRGESNDFCTEFPDSGSSAAFMHEDNEEDEDDDEEGDLISSIMYKITREQLCEQRTSSSSSAAAAADAGVPSRSLSSSVVAVNHGKRHSASSERLLRLQNQLSPNRSHSSAMTVPASLPTEPEIQQHTTEQLKSKKLRCAQCNKKLGMVMIMKCHCEQIFCAQHRYAEAHNCSYDFKLEGRKVLEKNNPLVVAEKLPKI